MIIVLLTIFNLKNKKKLKIIKMIIVLLTIFNLKKKKKLKIKIKNC